MEDTNRLDNVANGKLIESVAENPMHFPTGLPLNKKGKLDPQSLFDLVSKHYDAWLSTIDRLFEDDENFLPFPNEDSSTRSNSQSSQPIFDYSLLEALDKASAEVARDLETLRKQMEAAIVASTDKSDYKEQVEAAAAALAAVDDAKHNMFDRTTQKIQTIKEIQRLTKAMEMRTNKAKKAVNETNSSNFDQKSLLLESEMNYLQNKVLQIFKSNNVAIPPGAIPPGFGDEELQLLLLMLNQIEDVAEGQDDYDIDEIQDAMYNEYHPTHHIEVELNTEQGSTSRTVFNNQYDFEDDGGPSCEFTFEYDHTGKLVPTHNNVEEKLRLMSLQSRLRNVNEQGGTSTSKKKKKKKKKNQGITEVDQFSESNQPNPSCCLFCEYETIYGVRPRQMIKWYDQKMKREEMRRNELRKKLENAKLKALKKQRELRQKQQQQLQESQALQPLIETQGDVGEESKGIKEEDTHGATIGTANEILDNDDLAGEGKPLKP